MQKIQNLKIFKIKMYGNGLTGVQKYSAKF